MFRVRVPGFWNTMSGSNILLECVFRMTVGRVRQWTLISMKARQLLDEHDLCCILLII